MSLTKEQILSAAMDLNPAEKTALAEELLLSVGEADRAILDAAWLQEARRRDADFLAGKISARPAGNIATRLAAKVRQ